MGPQGLHNAEKISCYKIMNVILKNNSFGFNVVK